MMVSLRLLGGCSAKAEDRALTGEAGQARRMALLVLLASARTGTLSREKLIGFLWPDAGTDQARHLLSESLYQLRRVIGAQVLVAEGDQVRLNVDAVSYDVADFEAALGSDDLERAVAIYAGPFADGFYVRDAPEFERWVDAERRRLSEAYGMALERLARAAITRKNHVDAIRWLKRLVAHDPYASRYVIELMQVLAEADDPANALLLAEEHMQLLRDGLGVGPPEDVRCCVARVKAELARVAVGTTPSTSERRGAGRAVVQARSDPGLTQPAGRPRQAWRRPGAWLRAAVVAAGTLAIAAAALFIVKTASHARQSRAVAFAPRVAILPFIYRGSDDLAYLGGSLSHLLSTTLDGFAGLRAVAPRVDDVAGRRGSTTESEWAARVADRLGADRVVAGELVEVNGTLRIDARLHRFSGGHDEPEAATVAGTVDDFHTLTDRLTRQLLVMLVGPVRGIHSVAARTTDSLNALKAYLEGVAHRRAGRFDAAFASFRRAVEIDSTFALAWYGMGVAAAWEKMPEWDPGMEATVKAVHFSGSLPSNTQLVLRAYAAIMHGDGLEAERLTRAALTDHPDDVQAWFILAWAGSLNPFYGRPISEVREAVERAYRYDSYDPDNQSAAAWFAARERDWARLDSLWSDGLVTRALRAFGSQDTAAQRTVLAEAASADAGALSLASDWIAMTLQDIPAAARLARLAASREDEPTERALAHVRLAQLEWALGRWEAADAALDDVSRYDPAWAALYRALWASSGFAPVDRRELERLRATVTDWDAADVRASVTHTGARAHDLLAPQLRLYALGRLSLRLGDLDTALALANQLQLMGNPPAALSFAADRAQSLRAHVAFRRGAYAEALDALEAQPRRIRIQWLYGGTYFYPSPEDRFLRGEVLMRLGRAAEAARWFGAIQDITPYDAHYVALAHLRLAETHTSLGDAERAAQHYEEFINLWRDSDAALRPTVEDAQRARTALAARATAPSRTLGERGRT